MKRLGGPLYGPYATCIDIASQDNDVQLTFGGSECNLVLLPEFAM